jgi:hypothetical protein
MSPDEEGFLHIRDSLGQTHAVISGDIALAQE